VELLIVVWPLALLWLGLGQLGLLYAADILVTHAAVRAARAAIVILPDDETGWEQRYAEVEPLTLGGKGEGLDAYGASPQGGRLDAIRRAPRIILSPISPRLGGAIWGLFAGYPWTDGAVAVTFPSGDGYLKEFTPNQILIARVTYLFPCTVPIVDRLMCSPYSELDERSRRELHTVDDGSMGASGFGLPLGRVEAGDFAASRFVALRAEATFPMQGRRR
jgi:hypothetical protein